jgi:DNA-binding helix-hairpin-helix protein with protein kinase domain
LAESPDPILRNLYEKKKEAERVASHYEHRWHEEAGEVKFIAKLEELKEKKAEYVSLPALLQRKLNDLQKMSKERQLLRFLDTYRISDAKIENMGPDKKITLQAYGFETAADITRESLLRVPGFGGTLSYKLVSWRQSLEQKFVFNPSQSVTPTDKYVVDQEIHSIRLKLEQELANGPTHLRQIIQDISTARESLRDKLEEARLTLSQCELDLKAATKKDPAKLIVATMMIALFLVLIFQSLVEPRLYPKNLEPMRETISGATVGGNN